MHWPDSHRSRLPVAQRLHKVWIVHLNDRTFFPPAFELGIRRIESILRLEHARIHWYVLVGRKVWCVGEHVRQVGGSRIKQVVRAQIKQSVDGLDDAYDRSVLMGNVRSFRPGANA